MKFYCIDFYRSNNKISTVLNLNNFNEYQKKMVDVVWLVKAKTTKIGIFLFLIINKNYIYLIQIIMSNIRS